MRPSFLQPVSAASSNGGRMCHSFLSFRMRRQQGSEDPRPSMMLLRVRLHRKPSSELLRFRRKSCSVAHRARVKIDHRRTRCEHNISLSPWVVANILRGTGVDVPCILRQPNQHRREPLQDRLLEARFHRKSLASGTCPRLGRPHDASRAQRPDRALHQPYRGPQLRTCSNSNSRQFSTRFMAGIPRAWFSLAMMRAPECRQLRKPWRAPHETAEMRPWDDPGLRTAPIRPDGMMRASGLRPFRRDGQRAGRAGDDLE